MNVQPKANSQLPKRKSATDQQISSLETQSIPQKKTKLDNMLFKPIDSNLAQESTVGLFQQNNKNLEAAAIAGQTNNSKGKYRASPNNTPTCDEKSYAHSIKSVTDNNDLKVAYRKKLYLNHADSVAEGWNTKINANSNQTSGKILNDLKGELKNLGWRQTKDILFKREGFVNTIQQLIQDDASSLIIAHIIAPSSETEEYEHNIFLKIKKVGDNHAVTIIDPNNEKKTKFTLSQKHIDQQICPLNQDLGDYFNLTLFSQAAIEPETIIRQSNLTAEEINQAPFLLRYASCDLKIAWLNHIDETKQAEKLLLMSANDNISIMEICDNGNPENDEKLTELLAKIVEDNPDIFSNHDSSDENSQLSDENSQK